MLTRIFGAYLAPVLAAASLAMLVAVAWTAYRAGANAERGRAERAIARAERQALKDAGDLMRRDAEAARTHAAALVGLTVRVGDLLANAPREVVRYVQVPTKGADVVRCPAGVSPEFVRDWNAAAAAARAAAAASPRDGPGFAAAGPAG